MNFKKLHLLRLHVYIQLQSEARETEQRLMHITVPTSNGKLWYMVPVQTRPESPDGEWTVEIDPISSVKTSVSPSKKFIHVVVYIVQARFIYIVYIRFCFTERNHMG